MKHIGIIVAAGKGTRVGGDIPKQFMEVGGKPLLFYSLKAMQDSFIDEIIVVTSEDRIGYVKEEIGEKYGISKLTHIVKGGSERGASVFEGLRIIKEPEEALVYVHDGARPLLSSDLLERLKEKALEAGNAVAAVPSKDTVKIVDREGVVVNTPNRSSVWLAQTPQVFNASELAAAYFEEYQSVAVSGGAGPTDDASVMEAQGYSVYLVMGDYANIKVTTPEDIEIVRKALESRESR